MPEPEEIRKYVISVLVVGKDGKRSKGYVGYDNQTYSIVARSGLDGAGLWADETPARDFILKHLSGLGFICAVERINVETPASLNVV